MLKRNSQNHSSAPWTNTLKHTDLPLFITEHLKIERSVVPTRLLEMHTESSEARCHWGPLTHLHKKSGSHLLKYFHLWNSSVSEFFLHLFIPYLCFTPFFLLPSYVTCSITAGCWMSYIPWKSRTALRKVGRKWMACTIITIFPRVPAQSYNDSHIVNSLEFHKHTFTAKISCLCTLPLQGLAFYNLSETTLFLG